MPSDSGLVYSFATKDELVAAALEREMTRFQAAVDKRSGPVGPASDRQLLAHVEEALAEDDSLARQAAFLMVTLVHAPDMIGPARDFYRKLFGLFDPETARGRDVRQAILAVEGMFLLRGLGLHDVQIEDWRSVLEHAAGRIKNGIRG